MNAWSSVNLGDAMLADEPLSRLEESFALEYERAGCPGDMALFLRHESEGRLHCEVVMYFSPAAARIARSLGATPCPQPAREGLSLSVGAETCWRTLFDTP